MAKDFFFVFNISLLRGGVRDKMSLVNALNRRSKLSQKPT